MLHRSSVLPAAVVTACLLLSPARAQEPLKLDDTEFSRLVQKFKENDLVGLHRLHAEHFQPLSQEQCDVVALLAAERLAPGPEIAGLPPKERFNFLSKASEKVRNAWGINVACADILHLYLGETRRITDARVVPHLVEALDHPDPTVCRYAFYTLRNITRHETGEGYFGRGLREKSERHERLVKWWRDWWQATKDKHPIYDPELEKKLLTEMDGLVARIAKGLQPATDDRDAKFPGMAMFTRLWESQKLLSGRQGDVLVYDYDPSRLALFLGPRHVPHDELPRIELRYVFDFPDLVEKEEPKPAAEKLPPEKEKAAESLKKKERPMRKEVFSAPLEGTGITLHALVTSKDAALEQALVHILKRGKGPVGN
jgi:hypothetical protein